MTRWPFPRPARSAVTPTLVSARTTPPMRSPHRPLTAASRFAARRSCSWRAERPATPASVSDGS
jgi:hypothetical protein